MKDLYPQQFRLCYLNFFIILFSVFFVSNDAKTAPEFTITKSTENFKEIRIPLQLWNQLVLTDYEPSKKAINNDKEINSTPTEKPSNDNKIQPMKVAEPLLNSNNSETILVPIMQNHNDLSETYVEEILQTTPIKKPSHEIVLEVVVPGSSSGESLQEEITTQITLEPVLAEDNVIGSLPQEEVIAESPVADVVPEAISADQETGAVPDPADPTNSVLVQTSRSPCVCAKGACGCCATIFRQKGCANIEFLPEEFSFQMKMTMNGNVITQRKLPISDPPPVCFNPPRAPFLDICAQVKNIHFRDRNVHLCIDLDAGLGGFDIVSWNFNCVKFGAQGFQTGLDPERATPANRPFQSGGIFGLFGNSDDDESEEGFLDDVFFK